MDVGTAPFGSAFITSDRLLGLLRRPGAAGERLWVSASGVRPRLATLVTGSIRNSKLVPIERRQTPGQHQSQEHRRTECTVAGEAGQKEWS